MAGKRLGMRRNVALCLFSLLLIFIILGCQRNNVGTKTIGPEGGEVRSRDGRFRVTFPPGALTQEVEVTIIKIIIPDPSDLFDSDKETCEYTYNLDDIAQFLTLRPTSGYISAFETRDENDDSNVLIEPLFDSDDGNGDLRLMEDNTTIVDTNEENVIQEARLFTDQGKVLIPPKDIDLIGQFSVNKFTDPNGIPMLDIIFTPSNSGLFGINGIFLQFLNGISQGTELDMDNETGNFEIILPNLCDPFSGDPSITDATFDLELDGQMPFSEAGNLSLEYRTSCEESMEMPPPPSPEPPVVPTFAAPSIDGTWNFNCEVIMEAFPLIVPNLGDPFSFDAELIVIPETLQLMILPLDNIFTLDGILVPQPNGDFLYNGSGSGFLGDMNPGAANIQLEAEDWIFSQEPPGSFSGDAQPGDIFSDGVLRFNFPTLPLDNQSSLAECDGMRTGD